MAKKITNLSSLKIRPVRKFYYKGMLFSFGSSSASSLSDMVIDRVDKQLNLTIGWTAYSSDGGDDSQIIMLYKVIGAKIVPAKVIHTTKHISIFK